MTDYRFEGLGKEWVTIEAAELDALRERVRELEQHREELIALVDSRTQGWREHAEKAEAEAAKWKACALDNRGLLDAVERADKAEARAHAEFEIAQRERWFADDARRERDEAREDIKALVTLLRACGGDRKRLWTDNVRSEWRRIRDRKLLEVSE